MLHSFNSKVMRNNDIVVLSMYVVKTAAKWVVGSMVGSAALVSDAVHNLADIVQYVGISVTTRIANRPISDSYPVGRKALESIVGVIIGMGLLYAGLQFLLSGAIRTLNVFGLVERLDAILSLDLGFLHIESLSSTSSPLTVVVTLSGAALLSYIVYRVEMKNADDTGYRALESDAEELKADMWVEISVAIGFLAASLLELTFVDAVSQIIISIFVLHSGWDIVRENAMKLQGKAIPETDRQKIIKAVQAIEGVASDPLIADEDEALRPRVYYVGSDCIRIDWALPVFASSVQSLQLITNLAKVRILKVLSDEYDKIGVFISFKTVSQSEESNYLEIAIDEYLRRIWGLALEDASDTRILTRQFVTSDYLAVLRSLSACGKEPISSSVGNAHGEVLLRTYMLAYSNFWQRGARKPETEEAFRCLQSFLRERHFDGNVRVACENAIAFFGIEKMLSAGSSDETVICELRDQLKSTFRDAQADLCLRGEAAHLLARSYYKLTGYNLEKARSWFKAARDAYMSAENYYTPLFSDHVWTDWGNLEAQFYRLNEAEEYLKTSIDLKKIKGDRHGLAISFGCLANVFSRAGKIREALEYYEEDLRIVSEVGSEHDIPHVLCKIADIEIRAGLLDSDSQGIEKAQAALERADKLVPETQFVSKSFVLKGLIKAHFAKWWLNTTNTSDLRKATDFYKKLNALTLDKQNLYLRAITNRLGARIAAAEGDNESAMGLFRASSKCFSGMHADPDLPIQVALCGLELLRWKEGTWPKEHEDLVMGEMKNLQSQLSLAGLDVLEFFTRFELSDLRSIQKGLRKLRRRSPATDGPYTAEGNAGLIQIDRLIWSLEL